MKLDALMFSVLTGALVLQGCATTGSTTSGNATPASTAPVGATTPAVAPGPGAAVVPEVHGKPVVKADTKDDFDAIVAAIHQQMAPGGRWQYIDKSERATIDGSFADMGKLYDRFGSVTKMDQAAKLRLLADQSTINAILTRRDGERLICRSEVPVGSHLPIRRCRTYAQIQAEERGTQRQLMEMQNNSPQNNAPGSSGR
ncbi:MAG TPA: hypothetical protein VFQ95_05900 [Rhodanobacteraceae bacterium]|nr:hypothetical protein [Rhodanobacteraceae bacterium]